jgi:sugar fermentation stimulation protein A
MKKGSYMTSLETLPTKGIYTLIICLSEEVRLSVGKLGMQKFPKGYYAYTGSALGKGSTSLKRRVSRHLRKRKRNIWHIDFLLANKNATVTAVVAAGTSKKFECVMNRYVKREGKTKIPVKRFGSSDCKENCESHLLYFGEEKITSEITTLYANQLKSKPFTIDFGEEQF